jgi:regulator of replication initiation timing
MIKDDDFQKELMKLTDLFKEVDPGKVKLAEGLIEDAAFLRVQNKKLKQQMVETGMVRIHPQNPFMQKPVETAKQYLKNVNSYAVIIKALNGILQMDIPDEEDDFEKWMKERHEKGRHPNE